MIRMHLLDRWRCFEISWPVNFRSRLKVILETRAVLQLKLEKCQSEPSGQSNVLSELVLLDPGISFHDYE